MELALGQKIFENMSSVKQETKSIQSKSMGSKTTLHLTDFYYMEKHRDLSQKTFTEKKDIQNDGEIVICG